MAQNDVRFLLNRLSQILIVIVWLRHRIRQTGKARYRNKSLRHVESSREAGRYYRSFRIQMECLEGAMVKERNTPRRLFKYRAFNNLTLDLVISDKLYYADPSTFNDPLDTRPSLNADLPAADLERA